MKHEVVQLTIAGLLHDIGKIVYRAGNKKEHSILGEELLKTYIQDQAILKSIRCHHHEELAKLGENEEQLPYILHLANLIAASDAGAKKPNSNLTAEVTRPLYSVFQTLHTAKNKRKGVYRSEPIGEEVRFPIEDENIKLSAEDYQRIVEKLKLKDSLTLFEGVQDILHSLALYTSYIPAEVAAESLSDISFYDHAKITAALASCIGVYLQENPIENFKQKVLSEKQELLSNEMFLMFSCDFSGIQNFIYNITSDGALKSLRARSFFLELFLENMVDEFLAIVELTRANLLYTGGGHAYLLLPNTKSVREKIDAFNCCVNHWLQKNFGISLYLSMGYAICTANSLMNVSAKEEQSYKNIYQRLSRRLSDKKMQRYSVAEIRQLNEQAFENNGRECKVCGCVDQLTEDRCTWCNLFACLGGRLVKKDDCIVVMQERLKDSRLKCIKIPSLQSERYLYLVDTKRALELNEKEKVVRTYIKNYAEKEHGALKNAIHLYMGDYAADTILENLAEQAKGVERIAVMRADVDNLGTAFTAGFDDKDLNIARTMAFSRQMSVFFKFFINSILKGKTGDTPFVLYKNLAAQARQVVVVYSGGDDVFLLGAWNEVIETAVDLNRCFEKYTLGKLSLSAGISILDRKFPIHKAAYDTAELEDAAKGLEGKNAVALFSAAESHLYKWENFCNVVIGEKLKELQVFFDHEEQERGKAFLYQLLQYLRNSKEQINIARYAYLLARLEPGKREKKEAYKRFAKKMYQWILDDTDKQQLITAIYIYIYLEREKK